MKTTRVLLSLATAAIIFSGSATSMAEGNFVVVDTGQGNGVAHEVRGLVHAGEKTLDFSAQILVAFAGGAQERRLFLAALPRGVMENIPESFPALFFHVSARGRTRELALQPHARSLHTRSRMRQSSTRRHWR